MGASSAPTPNPSDPLTRRRPQSRPWLQIGNRSSRSRAAMEPSPRSTSTPRSIEPTRSTARGRLASATLRTALLAATAMIVASLSGCFASPPQIIQLIPNRGSVGVAADAAITVGFDRPVATGSIAGRFSVKPPMPSCDLAAAFSAGPDAACRVVWLGGDTGFTLLHPRAIFAPNRTYTFTLAGGISDPNGVVNSVDHQWSITSGQAPLIRAVDPPDGSTGVPVDTPISVTFSTSMDAAATDAAIRLRPRGPRDGGGPQPARHQPLRHAARTHARIWRDLPLDDRAHRGRFPPPTARRRGDGDVHHSGSVARHACRSPCPRAGRGGDDGPALSP